MYALGCYAVVARSVPLNYILLTVFTLCFSYCVGYITAYYNPQDVLIAAGLTAVMTIGLTIYAMFAKTDFTWYIALAIAVSLTLIVACVIFIFVRPTWLYQLICILCVILCCIYIIIDIQLITGKHAYKYSIDDYVMAAMCLYIDITRLFLELLALMGSSG